MAQIGDGSVVWSHYLSDLPMSFGDFMWLPICNVVNWFCICSWLCFVCFSVCTSRPTVVLTSAAEWLTSLCTVDVAWRKWFSCDVFEHKTCLPFLLICFSRTLVWCYFGSSCFAVFSHLALALRSVFLDMFVPCKHYVSNSIKRQVHSMYMFVYIYST